MHDQSSSRAEDHIFLVALVTFGIVFMPAWMPLLKPPPKVRMALGPLHALLWTADADSESGCAI